MENKFMKYYNRFIILIWALLWGIFTVQYMQLGPIIESICLSTCVIVLSYPFTTYLSKTLLQRAMTEKKMALFILQFIAVSSAISLIITSAYILFAYLEIKGVFPKSEIFIYDHSFIYDSVVNMLMALFINFGFCGLRFYEENVKLNQVLTESQLQSLKRQITPHFMFNVLNHVNILMEEDVPLASSLLIKYSDILRYQLYSGQEKEIELIKEIQFLEDFIGIEKMRWEDKLDVNCTWQIENGQKKIPPLLLITFIENAFKHVSRDKANKGYINIDFEQKGDVICLQVKNSKYVNAPRKSEHSGFGLSNAKKLLDLMFHNNYELLIQDTHTFYYTNLTIKL